MGYWEIGLGICDHFTEIPTEAVDDFVLLGDDVVDFLSLFT